MIAALEPAAGTTLPAAAPDLPARLAELQRTVSASRLNTWHSCRLKFWFHYVQRLTKPPSAARHVGSVVHSVLQAWNLARWRREPFRTEQRQAAFSASWNAQPPGIAWENEQEAQRQMAWGLLETNFRDTPIPADETPEAVEVTVEADLAAHGLPKLIGILDLVRSGGRIVDFKTSAKTPDAAQVTHQHETQTSCYAVLYREATGKTEGGIELHHLVKLKTPKLVVTALPRMNDGQRTRLFRLLESYVTGVQRRDFVPSPGMQCGSCEFFNECRQWH